MAKVAFTAGRVTKFKCPPDKKQAFLWDATTPGLGLRKTPTGKPSYVFQAPYQGRDIRITWSWSWSSPHLTDTFTEKKGAPMGKTKPPYPEAFKQQIVELFHSGRSQSELAREFDVSAVSIANWVARAAADAGKPLSGKDVLTTSEREELVRLRREVKRLQTERDILAKATAWFAGQSEKTSTPSTR